MSTPLPAGIAKRSAGLLALWTVAAVASAAAAAVLYRFSPVESTFYPKCILLSLTGLYCPGCGALRATHALLHGHFLTALDYNALYVVVLPFLVYGLASQALQSVTGRGLPAPRLSGPQAKAIFWAVLVFMLVRNLPVHPLSVLAP